MLLCTSQISDETYIPKVSCPSVLQFIESLSPGAANTQSACSVEIQLRGAGWNDAMVIGALANAWHESRWDASAVGDRGNSIGFWQLNVHGLGKGMGDLRYDHHISTERIIETVKLQKLYETTAEEAAKTFCRQVMRPSDSFRKSLARSLTTQLVE
jgi:hypothetical protein